MSTFAAELETACRAVQDAGKIALRYFRQQITFDSKPDLSPVTVADHECERSIAASLELKFPQDGILGEEGSAKQSRSGRRWIIDPIDGTRDFVRGSPAWAVLLGLESDGEVVVGTAHFPATGDTYFAAKSQGAFVNEERLHVSSIRRAADAVLCLNGLNAVARSPLAGRLMEWMQSFWAVRSMGGCLDAVMVARGQADLWIEMSGKPWDFAPLKIIAEESGGRFFDFQGRATIYGGNCVICTPGLEPVARELVTPASQHAG